MKRIFLVAFLASVATTSTADAGPLRNLAQRVRMTVKNRPLLLRPVALTRATVAAAVAPVTKAKAKPHCAECEKAAKVAPPAQAPAPKAK